MITLERATEIFKEMDTYTIELASDSSTLGPKHFQDLIATCRNYLNKVSLVSSNIEHEKLTTQLDLDTQTSLYELEYDNLMASDESVKRLASIDDRKSAVNHRLKPIKSKIADLKHQITTLDGVRKVIQHRLRELHTTMDAIKDHKKLMLTDLRTGSFYGDERTYSEKPKPAQLNELSEEELADMVSDIEGDKEPTSPLIAEEIVEKPEVEIVESEHIEKFLGTDTKPQLENNNGVAEDDLDAFLNDLDI